MAINFSAQFIVNEKTSTRVLRLTDTSTGFTLSKGNFIITFPDGSVVSNTDFSSPQISAPGGNTSISLITDIDNTVLTGTYIINYVAVNTSLNEFTKTETFDFNWEKPAKAIINDSDVVLPEVQFKDLTAYETSGSFSGVLTRNFYTTTPSTSEVGVITKTSVGDILTPVNALKYYEGIYLVKSDISVAYTHTSKSWLTVAYTDLLQETFDVREAPTQDELVALINTYKNQIEEYKTTNPAQYEILNEQYDLVLALYSHILARYQTNTLDGSKAILDQLLGLLPPASSYTYKATQMLPFTINFSTSLTGTGTTGTLPKFTGTTTLGDSIIKESGGMIGVGKTPTAVLDVNGAIKGTSIVKSGGTSSEFLKADGSVDANTYLTTGSASSNYQPLDGDLTAIAGLAGTIGLLRKTSANTWELDTSVYLTGINSGQVIAALGYTPENAANKGVNNGYAGLDSTGKVPSTQLPSYVDDVIEAANLASLPATGETGKIYVTLDTNKIYRWTGSVYVEVSPTVGVVWGAISGTLSNQTDLQNALNAKQGTLTLTTSNTSGPATLNGSTLNIPIYQGGVTSFNTRTGAITLTSSDVTTALGFTPVTNARTLTINGLTQDLSDNRSWTVSGTIPSGGTAGQILAKIDATNYNTQWIDNFASQLKHEVKLGATLTKGKAVYVSSADGTNMIVSAASNASEATSSKTLGLLETGGATNDLVKVVTEGLLAGLDTSTATAGDPVWLGTNGNLIFGLANKPTAPAHLVFIGIVTRVQSNNGEIFVKVQNGFELNEIHDVSIVSKANNDGLFYEASTGLWKNKSIATVLGYTPQPAFASGTGFVRIDGTTISYVNETYATTAQLDLKANILNPVFTDNIYISGTNPRLYFTDTDSNPDYTIFTDSGNFYILNQTSGAYKLLIQETGNISAGVGNSMIATSFIKRGGTSSEFLMADGSVTSGAVVNYPGIGIAVSGGGGWLTSIDDNSANWNAAYSARISSLVTSRSSGSATFVSNILDIPTYTISGLGGQPAFASGTGFVKISGTTISYVDETYYLASNPSGYTTNAGTVTSVSGTGTVSGLTLSGTVTSSGSLTLGGTIALASGDVTTALGFMPVSPSSLSSYLPLTGGSLANTLSSGYVLSVTNNGTAADSNGLYVNIDTASTGTPFKVARGGVSLINVNYLGATVLKSTITAIAFIKSSGTSSEYLMADGSVSTGLSFTYPGAGIVTSTGSAWGTSITDNSNNWNTAFGWGNHAGLYLPLSGGTLTGALNGTTASFTSRVLAGNTMFLGEVISGFTTIESTSGNGIWLRPAGASSPTGLRITTTGAATFSSSVTSGGAITASYAGPSRMIVESTTNSNNAGIYFVTKNSSGISVQGGVYYIPSATPYLTLSGDNTNLHLNVTSSGNVGIGTTTPGTKLETASFHTSDVIPTTGLGGSTTNAFITQSYGLLIGTTYSVGTAWLQSKYRDSSGTLPLSLQPLGGNVGIGTTAPQTLLSIETSGVQNTISPIITSQSSGTTYTGLYSIRDGAGDQRGLIFQVYTANVGLNEKMRITSGGNVGIGTTSPSEKLSIGGVGSRVSFDTTGLAGACFIGVVDDFKLSLKSIRGVSTEIKVGNDNLEFLTNTVERMRITSGGNVGIGTTAPNSLLTIAGSNYAVGGAFRSYGNLNIYTTNSEAQNMGGSLTFGGTANNAEIYTYAAIFGKKETTGAGSALGYLSFATDDNNNLLERMRITSGGNVGIGTTSPSQKLAVVGDIRGYKLIGGEAGVGAGNYTIFSNDDNVGYIDTIRAVNSGDFQFRFTGTTRVTISTGGNITATAFFESSDKTIKTLIEDNYQTKEIESVTAKLYLKNGIEELGYFAQDVQAILPSAVSKGADGLLNLSYREVHTAKIARLEKRVEELEAQLNSL